MSFKEKFKEYQQRREAKAYFNKNNSYKFSQIDFVVAFGITLAIGIFGLIALRYITTTIRINFSFLYVILGYLGAQGVLRYKGNGGNVEAALVSGAGMFLGMIIGDAFYLASIVGTYGLSVNLLDLGLYVSSFQRLFTSNIIQSVFCILGIFTTFYLIRNN